MALRIETRDLGAEQIDHIRSLATHHWLTRDFGRTCTRIEAYPGDLPHHWAQLTYAPDDRFDFNLVISEDAFSNPNVLVSVIGHELVHVFLFSRGVSAARGSLNAISHEALAYAWEIDRAARTGITGEYLWRTRRHYMRTTRSIRSMTANNPTAARSLVRRR